MKNQKLILKRPKSRNNKDIIKSLEYKRFYHNDRNLFRVLNKTNYMKKTCPYISEEKDLKSVLCKIKNELLFMEEPSIHNLKTENEEFSRNYKKITKKKNKLGPEDTFREIIEEYKDKGYKIPNLTVEHNLFQINPLIEGNDDKLTNGLYSNFISLTENGSKNGKNIAMKTMIYLRKMKNIVEKKLFEFFKQKNEGNNIIIHKEEIITMPIVKLKYKNQEENKKDILEKIKILLHLIEEEPLIDYTKVNRTPNKIKQKTNVVSKHKSSKNNRNNTRLNTYIIDVDKLHSSKYVSESFKKLSNPIFQNKISDGQIQQKKIRKINLYSDSKIYKNVKNKVRRFSIQNINENSENQLIIPKIAKNKTNENSHIKYLNTEIQILDNKLDNDSNTNRFTSTFYTNNTTQNNFFHQQEKSLLQIAYNNLVKDKYHRVEEILRNYLNKAKDYDDEKINQFINIYLKNNYLNQINDIKSTFTDNNIRKNTEKIYLNEKKINKIKSKLQKLYKEENIIKKMDKQYIRLFLNE